MNPAIEVEPIAATIDETNVRALLLGYDVIVDAMDNLDTRFLLNETAIELNIPLVHGAIRGLEGRALTVIPGKSACLRCIYKGAPPREKFPVLGTTPAIIACIQVTEVIKIITGIGKLLTDRLIIYDGQNMKFTELRVHRDETCEHCGNLKR
jgi:molybdopterin/thiamine biosynthesis adenylyltransferase